MLHPAGRAFLSRLFPGKIGKDLVTTTFVIAASWQLLLLFTLWSRIGPLEWRPPQPLLAAWATLYGASWVLLTIAMTNAGLATQMGFLGWTSVFRGKSPVYGSFPRHGLYRMCRHPVYFAMAMVTVSGPVWNVDHLLIASIFVTYCIVGPRLKEKRLVKAFGSSFEGHIQEVPFFPTPRSCWRAITTRREAST
jgi:protein-S-isoprenylcysteine O-methyltransferase Ste14